MPLLVAAISTIARSWVLIDMVREGLAEEVMSEQEGKRASGVDPVSLWESVHGQRL